MLPNVLFMRKILILLMAILLVACDLSSFIQDIKFAPVTETPSPDSGYTECAWTWATQPLPDLSTQVQSALETAGLNGVTALAEAFGENCITTTGEGNHFAAMETDFRIHMEVQDLTDTSALGVLLERILGVLDKFPPGATPGPQPGYIGVSFVQGTDEVNLWFTVDSGQSARALGLHGSELFAELQK
jgi:hypothetical protein